MMNDKEYKALKAKIQKYLNKWVRDMGLGWYHIDITWDRSYDSENRGRAGSTNMNRWQYREADITFYLPLLAENDDETIEKVVVHELCHVLLAPISVNMENLNDTYQMQIMEYTTELTQKAFWWTRIAGQKEKSPK